jgi:hypothetical protein
MVEPGVTWMAGFILRYHMEYSKDYISELMKYCDPYSILVLGNEGQLIRLFCPFPVLVLYPVGNLEKGDVVSVEAVKLTLQLRDVFIIEGKAYYIIYFRILL